MKVIGYSVLALVAGVGLGYVLTGWCGGKKASPPQSTYDSVVSYLVDTVIRIDTVSVVHPRYVEGIDSRRVTVARSDVDTVSAGDSLSIRAVRRVYADSLFRAVVSGVSPELDSLVLYRPVTTVSAHTFASVMRRPSPVRYPRCYLGITAGVTACRHGIAPGVSVGISYRIWP